MKLSKIALSLALLGMIGFVAPVASAKEQGKSASHRQDASHGHKGKKGGKSADHRKDGDHGHKGKKGGKSADHRKDGDHRNDHAGANGHA